MLFSTTINATALQSRSCVINSNVACSRKSRHFAPFLGHLPPFCHPFGFESGRGQPLSATQGKRVATFALVTTVGPQPRPARSTPGEPGRAADRQACAAWFKRRSQLRGAWGSTPEGRRPQIRGWRAGGSLAVSSPTPATPLFSPAKIRELNHAALASLSYPTDRQALRNPHVGRPGFLVSMSIHPRTAARPGRHAGLVLTPNCQSRSARSQHT